MKKKILSIFIIILVCLIIIPFILVKLAAPHEAMGVIIILFFILNPIVAAIVHSMIGKDIKKLWWIPLFFNIIFLFSYWIILEEIIIDLIFYAAIYFVVGLIFMFISFFVSKKSNKKS